MVLLDIDVDESISFVSDSPIVFLRQVETRLGETSAPTIFNTTTQTLTGPSSGNLEAASVFDISGVSSISFNYSNPFGTEATIGFALPPVNLGDVNLDGVVDFFDIQPFITVLSAQTFQAEADIDGNGVVDFFDIQPFIDILSGQ